VIEQVRRVPADLARAPRARSSRLRAPPPAARRPRSIATCRRDHVAFDDSAPPLRAVHALAALPAVGMLGGLPFANRAEPYVLGLPFLLAWIVGWIVMTSAVLGLIYLLDEAALRRRDAAGAAGGAEEPR
jgi:hypothetical protein